MKKKIFLCSLLIVICGVFFVLLWRHQRGTEPEVQNHGEDNTPEEQKEWEETRILFSDKVKNSGILQLTENEKPVFVSKKISGNKTKKLEYQVFEWNNNLWEEIQPPWTKVFDSLEFRNNFPADPMKEQDGNYYFSVMEYSDHRNDTIYRINESGQAEKINTKQEMLVQGKGNERENFWKYHILDDNSIVFEYGTKLVRYDLKTGNKLIEIDNMDTSSGELIGNMYYSMNESADVILVTDVKTGRLAEEINYKVPPDIGNGVQIEFCRDEKGLLYLVTTDGIFQKSSDSAELVRIVPFEKCGIYASTDKKDVLVKDMSSKDGIIYVSYYSFSEGEEQFYQYG